MRPKLSARPPRRLYPRAPMDEAVASAALAGLRGRPAMKVAPPKAGAVALALIKPFMKDDGLTLNEIRRRWPEIVGERLASQTTPEKLVKSRDGAVLTVAAASSAAPLVLHQERLMLDRLALAGGGGIVKIAIRQVASARPGGNVRPFLGALSAEDERALSQGLASVEDRRLKDALAKLGRAVVTRG